MDNAAKLEAFRRSMTKQVESEIARLEEQLAALDREHLAQEEQRAKAGEAAIIAQARQEAAKRVRQAAAHASREAKHKLLRERARLTEDIFAAARQKLLDFAATPAYEDYLLHCVAQLKQVMPAQPCILYLRPQDLSYASQLRTVWNTEIAQDDTLYLGGARAVCAQCSLVADQTLDDALDAQREWFCLHAGVPFEKGGISKL